MVQEPIHQIIERLHAEGGRMTAQRRLILDILASSSAHPTAEELHTMILRTGVRINLSTIYRTLNWLESIGQVSPRYFEADRGRERFDTSPQEEDHHHFRCRECNRIIEFSSPAIHAVKAQFVRDYLCMVDSGAIILTGTCSECLKNLGKEKRTE